MTYVTIPRDLRQVKTKVFLNLTARQLICFGAGIAAALPLFFILKKFISLPASALCMTVSLMPFFLFAMYEKNGRPLEKILGDMAGVLFRRAKTRPYRTENTFRLLLHEEGDERMMTDSTEKQR